jgi:hypothetical protein
MRVLNCDDRTIAKLNLPEIPQYSQVSYAITYIAANKVLITGGKNIKNLSDVYSVNVESGEYTKLKGLLEPR